MIVAIPPEFEAYAGDLVRSGAVASEQEAVAAVLRNHLAQIEALRADIHAGVDELDRGEGIDGEAFMRSLIEETRSTRGA